MVERLKKYEGTVKFGSAFNIGAQLPLDDRSVVKKEADLTNPNTWRVSETDETSAINYYEGMVVTALDTQNMFVLVNRVKEDKFVDVTNKNNWKKIGADLNIKGETVEIVTNTYTVSTPSEDNSEEEITVTNYYWWGENDEIASGSEIPKGAVEVLWQVTTETTEYIKDGEYLTPISREIAAVYKGGVGTYLVLDLDGQGFGKDDIYIKASALVDFSKYVENTVYKEKMEEIDSSITDIKDKMVTDVSISLGDPALSQFFNITKTEKDANGVISITYDASVLDTYDESIKDENGERLGENMLITDRYVKEMMSWTEVDTDDDWDIIDLPTDETEGTDESETTE